VPDSWRDLVDGVHHDDLGARLTILTNDLATIGGNATTISRSRRGSTGKRSFSTPEPRTRRETTARPSPAVVDIVGGDRSDLSGSS